VWSPKTVSAVALPRVQESDSTTNPRPAIPFLNMTTIPEDLTNALGAAGLADFFTECTDAHQNEYLKWIAEAKRPETRAARITKAIQRLSDKRGEEQTRAKKNR
jgi:uncharacterized protein YdeI (YjbR/CyaY-like superfamily)